MSSTPIACRKRLLMQRQVSALLHQDSTSRVIISNGSVEPKKTSADDSDSESADSDTPSGYSTPVGKVMTYASADVSKIRADGKLRDFGSVRRSRGVLAATDCRLDTGEGEKFKFKKKIEEVVHGSVNGRGKTVNCTVVPCDVTCQKNKTANDAGRCECNTRWRNTSDEVIHAAISSTLSGPERRAAYEQSAKAAGRVPEAKICARLERNEPLYPNCDMAIWLRTCDVEAVVPVSGQVTGQIPTWIRGSLLRNGPGRLHFGDDEFAHLFDGSALIHRYAIAGGTATYQSRFLRTDAFSKNSAAQRIVVSEFGTRGTPDPCQTIFNRVAAIFTPGEAFSDNAMISVYPFGDEFYAFTESSIVTRFDPITLHTIERVNLADFVGIVNHSAHPAVLSDGVVSLGMAFSASGPRYTLVHFPLIQSQENLNFASAARATSDEQAPKSQDSYFNEEKITSDGVKKADSNRSRAFACGRIVGAISARWPLHPAYMHTFGLTERYFVIVEQPMSVSVARLVQNQLSDESIDTAMRWFQDQPTLFHLIERSTGRHSHSFISAAFFFLHVINAFDQNDSVIIDICCYENPDMVNCMYIDALRAGQQNPDFARMFRGRPLRFQLPLNGTVGEAAAIAASAPIKTNAPSHSVCRERNFVRPHQLSDLGCETPRVPQHLVGLPYRYFYAISSDVDLDNPGTIIKVDTARKRSWRWCEDGVYPSEPVFVPRPSSKTEDDGVILSALTWCSDERRTALLVLDAPSWTEVGRVEFKTPGVVPKCLHGWFASNIL